MAELQMKTADNAAAFAVGVACAVDIAVVGAAE
jgi:hypothetical protein